MGNPDAKLALARVRYVEPASLNEIAHEAVACGPEVAPALELIALDDRADQLAQLCAVKALALIHRESRASSMARIEQRWRQVRPIVAKACSKDMPFYMRDWDPARLAKVISQPIDVAGRKPPSASCTRSSKPPGPKREPRRDQGAQSDQAATDMSATCIHGYVGFNCRLCAGPGRFRRGRYPG